MDFMIAANTDKGNVKGTNEDSLLIKKINTSQGKMVLAVLCDGMGGLEKGELASATVTNAFHRWAVEELPRLSANPIAEEVIRQRWKSLITDVNDTLRSYGQMQGTSLGTTAVAMLLTQKRYYLMNIGDSRAYEVGERLCQLTTDQTFVAREIKFGRMTEEQARTDARRNVLLQCIGATEQIYPEIIIGDVRPQTVYVLCSDGFRHEISQEEIFAGLNPQVLGSREDMYRNAISLTELNKQRQERDNISVIIIKTV